MASRTRRYWRGTAALTLTAGFLLLGAGVPADGSTPTAMASDPTSSATPAVPIAGWEWRRLDTTPTSAYTPDLHVFADRGGTHAVLDLTYLVDISEIADPTTRAAADSDYRTRLRAYTAAAADHGLTVSAVVGTPGWGRPEAYYVADIVTAWVTHYNTTVPTPQRVTGIEIDIEPWGTPAWLTADTNGKRALLSGWLGFTRAMITAQHNTPSGQRLPLRVDVPMWLDGHTAPKRMTFEGTSDTPTGHVFQILDDTTGNAVVVMAHKDTVTGPAGSADAVATEFEYGQRSQHRVKVVIGQEVAAVPGEPDTITFHNEGNVALHTALADLTAIYGNHDSFGGFSIDHIPAWAALHP